jgi:fimbrial chaperone protein
MNFTFGCQQIRFTYFIFSIGLSSALGISCAAHAQSVTVSPATVVLSDRIGSGSFIAASGRDVVAAFVLDHANLVQNTEGKLAMVSDAQADTRLRDLLRVGPRRFSVDPARGQQVRVALRQKPQNLPPGEYRSHVLVRGLDDSSVRPDESGQALAANVMSLSIPVQFQMAVRVLYRHQVQPEGGKPIAVALVRKGDAAELQFRVQRLGPTTLMAEAVPFARQADGKELVAWKPVPINIYPENPALNYVATVPAAEIPPGAQMCVRLQHKDPGAPDLPNVESCVS